MTRKKMEQNHEHVLEVGVVREIRMSGNGAGCSDEVREGKAFSILHQMREDDTSAY